jgi:hypothetical protein
LTDAEFGVLARFRFALRVFLRFSEDAARAAGVTPNQHQLLLAIRGIPGGAPTISDVAEWLQLRHHSTVELIDRAVEAGLIGRETDSNDPPAAAGAHQARCRGARVALGGTSRGASAFSCGDVRGARGARLRVPNGT